MPEWLKTLGKGTKTIGKALEKFWTWLFNTGAAPPAPASTWSSTDQTILTATLAAAALGANFDVQVTGLHAVAYSATFPAAVYLSTPGTNLTVTVGQPGVGAQQFTATSGASLAETAQNLTAAQPAGSRLFVASSDGNAISLVSLVAGPDGQLALTQAGNVVAPTNPADLGTATFIVNGVNSPLAANSINQTSPAPGVTLVAHKNGHAQLTAGAGNVDSTMPRAVLLVAVLWMIALLVVGAQYPHISIKWFGHHAHILNYHVPRTYGPVPGSLPWFGAVGGLLISLSGIFTFNRSWDRSYDYWHYLRPVSAALTGTVAAILVLILVKSADASSGPSLTNLAATSSSTRLLLDAVAILVGYRDETFRALMKRVVDVVIGPGTTGTPPGT
jgi:hypothetical protein